MNFLDVFHDGSELSPRLALWLVEHLPEDSATIAAMKGGPQFRAWTQSMYLQAAQVNLLFAANRQRGGKSTRIPLVKPPKKTTKTVTGARTINLRAVKARIDARDRAKRNPELT